MKALTLTQPWATLVALGKKQIETRSWRTDYRGPLAIHAAKGFPGWAKQLCYGDPFLSAMLQAGLDSPNDLPLGAVLATGRLTDVQLVTEALIWGDSGLSERDGWRDESGFGDFALGRYAWLLADVASLTQPVPARGSLGLWDWEPAR